MTLTQTYDLEEPATLNKTYEVQHTYCLLDDDADDMMDRFVMFTPILPSAKGFAAPLDTPYVLLSAQQMQAVRSQFHIPAESFVVLLLGEDGSEALRSSHPVDSTRLNSLIDTMPSRKIEMTRPHAN